MDASDQHTEKTLFADIERLREQFPQTQDLYREVCVLMFFRYGMTPTANKLYQLVRKGSMSAPAEALNRFWENLREKSRVTIIHPDLPDELRLAAGELTAALWKTAQATAQESLVTLRHDAQAAIDNATTAIANALRERDDMDKALEKANATLNNTQQHVSSLQQEIAALAATNAILQSQVNDTRAEIANNQQRFDADRRDHASELDKLRNAMQLAEERGRAMEARVLLEIDRERTAANKLQKMLDSERESGRAAVERHRIEINALQTNGGDLRQKIGVLEGTVHAMTAARDHALEESQTMRRQLDGALAQATSAHNEAERLRLALEMTQKELDSHAALSKIAVRSRKAKDK